MKSEKGVVKLNIRVICDCGQKNNQCTRKKTDEMFFYKHLHPVIFQGFLRSYTPMTNLNTLYF